MSNIDKRALRDSAESTIGVLENIAGFEPSDIDGDTVELRFETEDGFDTGCDVSIVDQCQKAADVIRALLDKLEAKDQRIAEQEVVKELFLRAKVLMNQSGGTPIENSLNPIDAWLYDAERAAAACKGE
ncbi:ead/Ea22-like family protein [Enterobacter bugandensis]|uniref:ead/Ea22-like family protein n=1 Tax=Enterobacter bugandensis TaxID=881260 RepID=UPI002005B9FA|nr:ead/Ea22-like family protein [Enterobacter bugandensis]MCK6961304.1 ead/Ea22-like family protein [Enterobacter bugandensis]